MSANPLFVGAPSNLRITANSPCRKSSSTARDIGALAYAGDPIVGLLGTLWVSTTLVALTRRRRRRRWRG